MNPLTQSKNTTILPILIALTLSCFGLSPQARAVCQEGCLTNFNTALGEDALLNNIAGVHNTAIGFNALLSNTYGEDNTAIGYRALYFNANGVWNTATGNYALFNNTDGFYNTATGFNALYYNTSGYYNTATGNYALYYNTNGNSNTATGLAALVSNTIGNNNTASGVNALQGNTTGDNNIALGYRAGLNLTTGSHNIDIGNAGHPGESGKIRIGTRGTHTATFIAGIIGVTVPTGVAVIIDGNGHLGTTTSSARFKENIKPMDKASEAILALKPVTFRYKQELDPEGIPQFGLVAEQVEKVNPDLVARDEQGKPYTVRYEAVNGMLLNEFLKEHRTVEEQEASIAQVKSNAARQEATIALQNHKIQEQEATITQLEKGMKTVVARLQEQASQIQKVSAELAAASPSRGGLEVEKSSPQIVLNNQ